MTGRGARVLVLVTFLLVACTRNQPGTPNTPSPLPSSKIGWADCRDGFQCGSLEVPLDYSKPDGQKIKLALLRKPATQAAVRIGSVLINPGGPGASGINYVRSDISTYRNLNRRFDIVTWDPRGVGASAPVQCVDSALLEQYLALDSVLDDPQEKQAGVQANKDFADACRSRNAEILPYLDTANTARDLDQIRAAVGDEKLTYLGFSYGTFIGQWYAHLFPTRVRALSLDGVVDPTISANDSLLGQVTGFEQNLQAYLANCRARGSACAYGRSGDPGAKLSAAMASLDANPIKVRNRLLTRSLAMTGVLVSLYSQELWADLDLALAYLDRGDGSILLALADLYDHRNPDGTYENFVSASWATYCLDFAVPTDIAAYDRLGPAFAKASPFFGPWTQYSNLQCAYWPVKPKRSNGPITVNGAPTILLVGRTDDPATPYSEAQSVNRQIASSVLLTSNGNGHTSYGASPCVHAAEDAYLISLTLPAEGAVCSS